MALGPEVFTWGDNTNTWIVSDESQTIETVDHTTLYAIAAIALGLDEQQTKVFAAKVPWSIVGVVGVVNKYNALIKLAYDIKTGAVTLE